MICGQKKSPVLPNLNNANTLFKQIVKYVYDLPINPLIQYTVEATCNVILESKYFQVTYTLAGALMLYLPSDHLL